MKTDQPYQSAPVFLQTVSVALAQLKQRLQQDYEQAYPNLRELFHIVLDEEEAKAWELTLFPHLLLPDLFEAHIANLNLQPAKTNHRDLFAPDRFSPVPSYKFGYPFLRVNGEKRTILRSPQIFQTEQMKGTQ